MYKIIIIILCGFFSFVANAQGLSSDDLALQRLQDRILRVERDMTMIQKELYQKKKIDESMKNFKAGDVYAVEEMLRKQNGRIEELQYQITKLRGEISNYVEESNRQITLLREQIDKVDKKSASIVKYSGEEAAKIEYLDEKEPVAIAREVKRDENEVYDEAMSFLKQAKYKESAKLFEYYVKNYPQGEKLNNAYYWLAESHYVEGNYDKSSVWFLKSYQAEPTGNRAPDSLFKMGFSLAESKKKKESCATLAKFLKEFPKADSDLITKSKNTRKELGC